MEDARSTSRRLTKKPPPGFAPSIVTDANSLRSQRSSGSLQRSPSAPTNLAKSYATSHHRTATNTGPFTSSSSSSLERQTSAPSPVLTGSTDSTVHGGVNRTSNPTAALNEKTSEDSLIGAPFDGSGILNHIDSTKATGYQNSLRRPPPPPLAYTNLPQSMSPPLRQSASFSAGDRMNEKAPPRISENQLITPKRYSDESSKEPKPGVTRKQSGLKSIFGSMGLMSPRGPKISAPENPVHVTHVGYDNQTGQFTVSSSCVPYRIID